MFLSSPDKAQQGQKKKKNVTKLGQECLEIDTQAGTDWKHQCAIRAECCYFRSVEINSQFGFEIEAEESVVAFSI